MPDISFMRRPLWSATTAPWLLVLAGFVVMYVPSYLDAAKGMWQMDDYSHGPLILAVVCWLFWVKRVAISEVLERPLYALGWPLLGLGLFLYAGGRIFLIPSIEFLSQLLVVAAVLLLLKGTAALRAAWFAVLYLVFMVPLPGTLVDGLTAPLTQLISVIVVELLHFAGYPIARIGALINLGQYQLLVAEACSGLNSMFSLFALGALYMYLMARASWLHNLTMIASIIPVAFFANIVRVIALVLITYYLGDEAGQGFLHGAAGIVLMVVALASFFSLDAMLLAIGKRLKKEPPV